MLPTANPAILFKQMDDGAVLFSPGTEIYFGLNEVGARIWQLLPEAGGSLGALCARLSSEYPGVPLDTIRRDVEELLGELVNEGLAAPAASSASDASTDAASTP